MAKRNGAGSTTQRGNMTHKKPENQKHTTQKKKAKNHVRPLLNLDRSNGAGLLRSELLLLGPEGLTPNLVPGELCTESKDRSESMDRRTGGVTGAGEKDADADAGVGEGGV